MVKDKYKDALKGPTIYDIKFTFGKSYWFPIQLKISNIPKGWKVQVINAKVRVNYYLNLFMCMHAIHVLYLLLKRSIKRFGWMMQCSNNFTAKQN